MREEGTWQVIIMSTTLPMQCTEAAIDTYSIFDMIKRQIVSRDKV